MLQYYTSVYVSSAVVFNTRTAKKMAIPIEFLIWRTSCDINPVSDVLRTHRSSTLLFVFFYSLMVGYIEIPKKIYEHQLCGELLDTTHNERNANRKTNKFYNTYVYNVWTFYYKNFC